MNRALTKVLKVTSEKEIIVLKKKATILKFEESLNHDNSNGYILDVRLYTSPNDAGKTHSEGKNPGGKMITKL